MGSFGSRNDGRFLSIGNRSLGEVPEPQVTVARLRQLAAENVGCNERTQNLSRAAGDREHTGIPNVTLQWVVARIPGGTEDLQGIVGYLDRGLGSKDLGARRHKGIGKATRWGARRRLPDQRARGFETDRHVGDEPLQPLEFGNRTAELLA